MASPGPGPGDPDEQYDFLFKLVLVGDASVGKTCVVQRFKTGAFSERQGSTIGVDFTMKTLEIQGKRVKVGGLCGGPWKVVPQQAGRGQMGQSFLQIPECCFPPLHSSRRSRPGALGSGPGSSTQSVGLEVG